MIRWDHVQYEVGLHSSYGDHSLIPIDENVCKGKTMQNFFVVMKTLNRNRDSRDDVYRSFAYESNDRYIPETSVADSALFKRKE